MKIRPWVWVLVEANCSSRAEGEIEGDFPAVLEIVASPGSARGRATKGQSYFRARTDYNSSAIGVVTQDWTAGATAALRRLTF